MAEHTTLAVILAAGGGTRFHADHHKLLAQLGERTVLGHAIHAALAAQVGPVLVVTGAANVEATIAAVDLPKGHAGLHLAHNSRWADGQATSLRVAADIAGRFGYEAMVVGLGDQPFITPEAWRQVAESTSPIAVALYPQGRRNPVRLSREVWSLLPVDGDEGARSVMRVRPELVEEIPSPGSPADIDTMEDLEAWQNKSSTNSP